MIIDASALLAFLFQEPGHRHVAEALAQAPCISAVNVSEVILRFVRDGHPPDTVLEQIAATPLEVAPFLTADAALAAGMEPATRSAGLSFAARACLALGLARAQAVLTADRAWSTLDTGVEVRLIR